MPSNQPRRPRVAVAGASGFIGTAVCRALTDAFSVRALTRSPARAQTPERDQRITWRHCDLFSAPDLVAGLADCDYAVYLVHSLAPSSRLTQANPRDLDLILADNFARAAAANGVKQIIVVGGLIPDSFRISPLLWSRREVELVLASRGTPVTALRAG
ncbi:NAD(P)H-binding protein, partial [Thiocapsa sp.]|uniref:NAD(P)H-binding protein n=1 Tax=Thiocapsa sp. TaxID=2024551 RepID=UPI00359442AA